MLQPFLLRLTRGGGRCARVPTLTFRKLVRLVVARRAGEGGGGAVRYAVSFTIHELRRSAVLTVPRAIFLPPWER